MIKGAELVEKANANVSIYLRVAIRTASGFGKEGMPLFEEMVNFMKREREDRLPGLLYNVLLPCPECNVPTIDWDPDKETSTERYVCSNCHKHVRLNFNAEESEPLQETIQTRSALSLALGKFIINPKDCVVMVSFNDAASGQDAEDLANHLTANGHPTFCTRIFCPKNPGSWRQSTKIGTSHCKIYVPLMSNGWQKSNECQVETRTIENRLAREEVIVIPVYYDDFDPAYDIKADQLYKLSWGGIQSVKRQRDDSWRKRILELLSSQVPAQSN